jgi:hypothetical protein
MRLRRGRFDDLIHRQLDLFASDEAVLIAEAEEADAAWTNASREDAEDLYGDYQLIADAIGERLHDVRETYVSSLEEQPADDYRDAFNRAVAKRFRRFAGFLEE